LVATSITDLIAKLEQWRIDLAALWALLAFKARVCAARRTPGTRRLTSSDAATWSISETSRSGRWPRRHGEPWRGQFRRRDEGGNELSLDVSPGKARIQFDTRRAAPVAARMPYDQDQKLVRQRRERSMLLRSHWILQRASFLSATFIQNHKEGRVGRSPLTEEKALVASVEQFDSVLSVGYGSTPCRFVGQLRW